MVAVILLVVGASIGVGAVHWGLNRVRDLDHLEHHGAFATARVASTTQTGAPSGSVCVTLVSLIPAVAACPPVDDPSAFTVGDPVTVRYDLAHRDQMLVVGHEPDIAPVTFALLGAAAIVVAAALLLATSWRDDDDEPAAGVKWVAWMGLAGCTGWVGMGYAAVTTQRRRTLWWVPVYGVGLVATVVLFVASATRPGLELVAAGLWLAVWIGGTVHGVLLVPTVSRERVRVTERRHSTLPPPPPPSASAWLPSTPTRVARRSVVGVVDLPWLADPAADSDGTLPTVHAETDGRVLCGAHAAFLLPTLRRWGSSGRNPATVCSECVSMVDPPVVRRRRRPAVTGGSQPVWSWNDAAASAGFLSVAGAVILTAQAIAVARRLQSRRRWFTDPRPDRPRRGPAR